MSTYEHNAKKGIYCCVCIYTTLSTLTSCLISFIVSGGKDMPCGCIPHLFHSVASFFSSAPTAEEPFFAWCVVNNGYRRVKRYNMYQIRSKRVNYKNSVGWMWGEITYMSAKSYHHHPPPPRKRSQLHPDNQG